MPKAEPQSDNEQDSKPYSPSSSPNKSPTKSKSKSKSINGISGHGNGNGVDNKWTPEETWALFEATYEKKKNVNWDEVAKLLGRDKKVSDFICFQSLGGCRDRRLMGLLIYIQSCTNR